MAGADAGGGVAGFDPGACAKDGSACLYPLGASYSEEVTEHDVTDETAVGGPRAFRIAVRYPQGAAGPAPVVIWSHGGAHGMTDPTQSIWEWCSFTARQGYASVCIAHPARSTEERKALCQHLGKTDAECQVFKWLNWDRPYDIRRALDFLEELGKSPAWKGRLDLAHVAVAGHSAGAGGAMMVAGASREYVPGVPLVIDDPRPSAFITLSPQGPGSEGFTESSFAQVTRPNLVGTGLADETDGDDATTRVRPHQLMPPGDKYQIFIDDPLAFHYVFGHSDENCDKSSTPARCHEFFAWLESTTLAFLDGYLRGLPAAKTWLGSSSIEKVSGDVAKWSVR